MTSHHKDDSKLVQIARVSSGGVAGIIAELVTLPVDTLKVRAMVAGEHKSHMNPLQRAMSRVKATYNYGGARAFYGGRAGSVAAVQRQMVMNSVKIGFYEQVRDKYCELFNVSNNPSKMPMSIKFLSGCTTGVLAVCVGQPTDVVKVRCQANPSRYKTSFQAYKEILKYEGVKQGLWRGTVPSAKRSMAVTGAEVGTFDVTKTYLKDHKVFEEGFFLYFSSALFTGFVATIVATPSDVIKTVYSNKTKHCEYSNVFSCTRDVWVKDGFKGFYKGVVFNGCRLVLWNVCMFVSHEYLIKLIDETKKRK